MPTTGVMRGARGERHERGEATHHLHPGGVEADLLGGLAQGARLGGLAGVEAAPGEAHLPGVGAQVGGAPGEDDPGLAVPLEQGARGPPRGRRGRESRRR